MEYLNNLSTKKWYVIDQDSNDISFQDVSTVIGILVALLSSVTNSALSGYNQRFH